LQLLQPLADTHGVSTLIAPEPVPAVQPSPGLRARKKAATRETLRRVALRLAVANGLDVLTVEAIAEAADVSPRTFFNYFASKEDALLPADIEKREAIREALVTYPADQPPLAALRSVLMEIAEAMAAQRDDTQLRMQLLRDYPVLLPRHMANLAAFERSLVEGIAARTGTNPETDVYPGLVATVAVAIIRSCSAVWTASLQGSGPRRDLSELFSTAFAEITAGLPAPTATVLTPRPEERS
jgi:AcrR family transcriptional regulator